KQLCFSVFSMSLLLLISEGTYAIDVEAGRVVSTRCAVCHGIDGEGHGIPKSKISGMDVDEFIRLINLYKSSVRRNYMMESYTKDLSKEDIENLSAYYATK
ncbi:MAG: c-type cytochrome, partial [Gammaproteobacteria bacterium]